MADVAGPGPWTAGEWGLDTLAIHAGQDPDPAYRAVAVPVYQTSTYAQPEVGQHVGPYDYARSANPTRTALEQCLAALEGGSRAVAFSSGLAAEDALLRALLKPGDHLVIPDDAYGGTYRLIDKVLAPWGVAYSPVAVSDVEAVRAALRTETKVVWVETPTNPLLGIADIRALADAAHEAGALLVVDSTFASPALQNPLALGADVVVHSTTKYLGGHSDVVGGALVAADPELGERLVFHQNSMGAVPGPWDCWLTLRGIKTLGIRMERHCANARRVVEVLQRSDSVREVRWPGLPSHPGHEVATRQMRDFGGMVSVRMAGGVDAALALCRGTHVFTLAESLGGVESLIELPARMTHASVSGSALEVPADLVRLSVGIESADDLVTDLERALTGLPRA